MLISITDVSTLTVCLSVYVSVCLPVCVATLVSLNVAVSIIDQAFSPRLIRRSSRMKSGFSCRYMSICMCK